jgi:hypothetical protein
MSEVNAMQKQSEADELKSLADKFLESQGVATKPGDAKKADVLPPSTNVLIGVPCFGGLIQQRTVSLLLGLTGCLSKAGFLTKPTLCPASLLLCGLEIIWHRLQLSVMTTQEDRFHI